MAKGATSVVSTIQNDKASVQKTVSDTVGLRKQDLVVKNQANADCGLNESWPPATDRTYAP